MAQELKGVHWDKLKPERRKHLMRYPWHEWFNGSTWLLLHGEDFDLDPEDMQRYVLEIARENDLKVKTLVNEERNGVYIKKTQQHTDRFKRMQKEWEQRWETQKRVGIHEWWKYPERLDDLRARRRAAREDKRNRQHQKPKQPHKGEPYIPGWQKVLMEKGQLHD